MDSKQLRSALGLFLLFTGISALSISLLSRRTESLSRRIVRKSGTLFIDFLIEKYLPQRIPQWAKIIPSDNFLPVYGSKGGRSTGKRYFKKSAKTPSLKAF